MLINLIVTAFEIFMWAVIVLVVVYTAPQIYYDLDRAIRKWWRRRTRRG